MLVEILGSEPIFRFRLVGTRIVDAYGRDSTGKTLEDAFRELDPEAYRFTLELGRAIVDTRSVARMRGPLRPAHRSYRDVDGILLPLDAGDGSVGMILLEEHFT